jgi:hypothetical protein
MQTCSMSMLASHSRTSCRAMHSMHFGKVMAHTIYTREPHKQSSDSHACTQHVYMVPLLPSGNAPGAARRCQWMCASFYVCAFSSNSHNMRLQAHTQLQPQHWSGNDTSELQTLPRSVCMLTRVHRARAVCRICRVCIAGAQCPPHSSSCACNGSMAVCITHELQKSCTHHHCQVTRVCTCQQHPPQPQQPAAGSLCYPTCYPTVCVQPFTLEAPRLRSLPL